MLHFKRPIQYRGPQTAGDSPGVRRCLVLALCSLLSWPVIARARQSAAGIEWRSGRSAWGHVNRNAVEVADALEALAKRPEARHVVVRFDGPPNAQQRAALGQAGVKLLRYLGDNAFFASLSPDGLDTTTPAVARIADVGLIEAAWKVHPHLVAGQAPSWAVVASLIATAEPTVATYVLFHSDVSLTAAAELVDVHGGSVRCELRTVNGLVVEIPLSGVALLARADPVQWIEPALPRMTAFNNSNRQVTQADTVQAAPYNLDGAGVTVLVYDAGSADATHLDFGGRLTVRDGTPETFHATHVAGTIGGDGSASSGLYRGMAPGVLLESYAFESDQSGISFYTNPGDLERDYDEAINVYGADLANNSIGINICPNGYDCELTGDYGVTSQLIDAIIAGGLGPAGGGFRSIWANGNERACGYCRDVGVHTPEGYHSTAPPACAKNHITVGALNSNDDSMTWFSSWGPTDDGRIKPDICGPGCQTDDDAGVTSTTYGHGANGYFAMCGTSMAAPTVTGLAALLLQDYRQQFPDRPDLPSATLKALLVHNAQDIEAPGPDYKSGYGSVRIKDTVDFMRTGHFAEDRVDQGETYVFLVPVEAGDQELTVTLAWDDAPGTPNVETVLVNDLDLRVFAPSGIQHFPWTLDPDAPALPADRTQPDHLNNVEQVVNSAALSLGLWRVEVHGFSVPLGPQAFSLCGSPRLSRDCDEDGVPDDQQIAADPSLDCTGNGIIDACEPDCDGDGTADSCAIAAGAATDCNLDGVPDTCEPWADCNSNGTFDACDIADGSIDCDLDAVPDECQPDCNTNGTADTCDIAAGTSLDCNTSGVPDECELADGAAVDCNTNAVPDECDLTALTSDDCNHNNVPDECDIASGAADDCDQNGAPDECWTIFAPVLNLANLHGVRGFAISGLAGGDYLGQTVAGAGDLNDDGVDDLLIGAPRARPDGVTDTGRVYVIFGGIGLGGIGSVDLAALNGVNGFVIDGLNAGDLLGTAVAAAGDVNGDGIDDVIVGASEAAAPGHVRSGQSYVIFGASGVGADGVVNAADLDGANGFAINGVLASDACGASVASAGDVNADGVDDLVIGAWRADPDGNASAGEAYVVFGGPSVGQSGFVELAELDGDGGFTIRGTEAGDWLGYRIAACGDINADGVDDLAVSAAAADGNQFYRAGEVYVIFGRQGLGAGGTIDPAALDGSDGFVVRGVWVNDMVGSSLSNAGDLDGDGVTDLLLGAPNVDPEGRRSGGAAYVVFGGPFVGVGGVLNVSVLAQGHGLVVNGIGDADAAGFDVSGAGDVNGDGLADLMVGAVGGDPNGSFQAGEVYVVLGSRQIGADGTFDPASLDGGNGFVINGVAARDLWGWSVAGAGDLNGDGLDDVVVGTPYVGSTGFEQAGAAYVVFGRAQPADCDGNQVPDSCDLADDTLPDVFPPGGDGVPDTCQADCNDNGMDDSAEILDGDARDCNHNAVPDACEIADATAADQWPLGGDGIPDECQTDCDNNGIPDAQDLAAGTSQDCNHDVIPDGCDIASGTSQDCNSNAVPDECDITTSGSGDCNENDVPDECDVGAGLSQDCNANLVPDECEADCNTNGIPDECDIAQGSSADIDANGVPDECHAILRVPAQYATIQAALDQAQTGDTVLLADGVYQGPGNRALRFYGKGVLLSSENGPAACVIDGMEVSTLFRFINNETAASHVRGLTIANGYYSVGGAFYCASGSPTISECIIRGNGAIFDGGALYCTDGSTPVMRHCTIADNTADGTGGGVAAGENGAAILRGCVFTGNTAWDGGATSTTAGSLVITNCTFLGNSATSRGGAVYCSGGAADVRNSVLWDDSAPNGPELALEVDADATVVHCDVAGGLAYAFVSDESALTWLQNIDTDPMFADAEGGDFHLLGGSPCIDAGDPDFAAVAGQTDFDGQPRVMRGLVDIGADEFGDDCNSNGVPDLAETIDGTRPDVNENLIPDECEPPVVEGSYAAAQHGEAGTFRIRLEDGDIEPRRPGAGRLEFEMSVEIDPDAAAVGSVSAVGAVTGPYQGDTNLSLADGPHGPNTRVVVAMDPPLANADCWTVELIGLGGRFSGAEVFNPVTRVRPLHGDLNRDGIVSQFDLMAVKPHFGELTDATNFLFDHDANGIIATTDFGLVKPYLGSMAPDCPG